MEVFRGVPAGLSQLTNRTRTLIKTFMNIDYDTLIALLHAQQKQIADMMTMLADFEADFKRNLDEMEKLIQ